MTLQRVAPFVGTAALGRALNADPSRKLAYRVTFTDGSTMKLTASSPEGVSQDAAFWAGFTGREVESVQSLNGSRS